MSFIVFLNPFNILSIYKDIAHNSLDFEIPKWYDNFVKLSTINNFSIINEKYDLSD